MFFSKFKIRGKSTYYNFFDRSQQIFSAKMKWNQLHRIVISTDLVPHLSRDFEYIIMNANSTKDFSLRAESEFGKEIMNMRFFPPRINTNHRYVITKLNAHVNEFSALLFSKPAQENQFLIKNLANLILSPKKSNTNCIIFQQTDTDTYQIESKLSFPPIALFAIAISSLISKVK